MGDWNKSENETHLNQLQNWMSSAIHNSEDELQSCDINDAFALTNVLLRKTLSTCFPKKKKIQMKKETETWVELQITSEVRRQKDEVL